MAALIREDHFYYLGARTTSNGCEAFLEKAANGLGKEVAKVALPGVSFGEAVVLRVEAQTVQISFFVERADGSTIVVAENEDATILTTNKAWGFVGAMIGPYARLESGN